MSDKNKSAFIIRDFKDAGTEESFTQGDIVTIAEGAYLNYEAAGLVRKPTADDKPAAAAKSDTKPAA